MGLLRLLPQGLKTHLAATAIIGFLSDHGSAITFADEVDKMLDAKLGEQKSAWIEQQAMGWIDAFKTALASHAKRS